MAAASSRKYPAHEEQRREQPRADEKVGEPFQDRVIGAEGVSLKVRGQQAREREP
jgi:hypothetical protein